MALPTEAKESHIMWVQILIHIITGMLNQYSDTRKKCWKIND